MKTLKEAVEAEQCRKGKADGTTKRGAYWLATDPIIIRRSGGDGIGQSSADVTWTLELRHYRSGEVRPVIHRDAWHQNGSWSGAGDDYYGRQDIGGAGTIEEVVVRLKNGVGDEACYSDKRYDDLRDALLAIGMTESIPGPDEVTTE